MHDDDSLTQVEQLSYWLGAYCCTELRRRIFIEEQDLDRSRNSDECKKGRAARVGERMNARCNRMYQSRPWGHNRSAETQPCIDMYPIVVLADWSYSTVTRLNRRQVVEARVPRSGLRKVAFVVTASQVRGSAHRAKTHTPVLVWRGTLLNTTLATHSPRRLAPRSVCGRA